MNRPPISQQVTFLYTRDLTATAVFYEKTLELPLILDQGSCRIYQINGDAFLGFCQRVETPERPVGIIFTLVTADVDGWHAYLQSKGVSLEKAPQHNPEYNIYHFFLRDPNGYLIEIQRFLDPAWPNNDGR
jgi:catechol 2,3-dioxygenase-like lactoylglutathione lyase family enzyme